MKHSKPLRKTDESATRLIIKTLNGQNAYGINIDGIFKTPDGWILMEFLKTESRYVTPCTSHPRRYWDKNWRKFVRLWEIARRLEAKLYLINYEEKENGNYGKFRIMEVNMCKRPDEQNPVETKDIIVCEKSDFETFKKFYLKINEQSGTL